MNKEMVNQITEVVKSINVGFDGKLNSETLVEISKEITPQIVKYLYFIQIKGLVVNILWASAVVISAWLIGKSIYKVLGEKK